MSMNRLKRPSLVLYALLLACYALLSGGPAIQQAWSRASTSDPRSPVGRAAQAPLKVLSYNVERGLGPEGCRRVAELLQAERPDIVCLQEVAWPKKPSLDWVLNEVETVAEALGYDWAGAERGRLRYESYGMAVLVRGRIIASRTLEVSGARPYALWTELEVDGRRFNVASVHACSIAPGLKSIGFLATEWPRIRQARHLLKQVAASPCPVIVAGDFNTIATSPSHALLTRTLLDAAAGSPHCRKHTRLTSGLPLRIDYVLVSPGCEVLDYDVLPVDGSDHRPVWAVLKTPSPAG